MIPAEVNAGASDLSGSQESIWHLPTPLTPFVGREQELQTVAARLLRPEVRLLTLTGTGGVGKTRLTLALVARVQQAFAQGVHFVSLETIHDPEQVIPVIVQTIAPFSQHDHPFEQLIAYLQKQQTLLILDNFEQLLPAAPLITEILSACPQLKILVTSRAVLHVQGEYQFDVPALALPDLHALPSPDNLSKVAAIALFVERVEALKPGFELTKHNAALIAELCVLLAGIPLAIELAAGRSKLLSLDALLSRLKQSLDVLSGEKQNIPFRHQSLHNTIAWSYDLLSSEEQKLFRRLCIFRGAFTLEVAEAIIAGSRDLSIPVLDGVASLIDKSLLHWYTEDEHELRLYLPEILRIYGLEQLTAWGELEHCRQAYAAYYLALTRQDEENLSSSKPVVRLKRRHATQSGRAIAPAYIEEQSITVEAVAHLNGKKHPRRQPLPSSPILYRELTAREGEVLRLLAQGLSNNQIAAQLVLSPYTVNRHTQSIYGKLGVNSRSAATRFAVEHLLL